MSKTQEPNVSALVAAQERMAELNVEEAKIFIDIIGEAAAKCDAIIARYDGLNIRPQAVDQVINHRESLRHLTAHMERVAGLVEVTAPLPGMPGQPWPMPLPPVV